MKDMHEMSYLVCESAKTDIALLVYTMIHKAETHSICYQPVSFLSNYQSGYLSIYSDQGHSNKE